MVPNKRPPITARPRGAFCSPPSPRPKAIGNMPITMASAVISTGRNRPRPASKAARRGSVPCASDLARKTHHENAVGGRDADAHDGPGQRRHADRRAGDEQHPHDADQGSRQPADDDQRVDPRLKVDHHEQVHEQHGEAEPGQEARERGLHGLHLTTHHDAGTGRQAAARLIDQGGDLMRHAARDHVPAPTRKYRSPAGRCSGRSRPPASRDRACRANPRSATVAAPGTGACARGRACTGHAGAAVPASGMLRSACSESTVYCGVMVIKG